MTGGAPRPRFDDLHARLDRALVRTEAVLADAEATFDRARRARRALHQTRERNHPPGSGDTLKTKPQP